LWSERRRDRCKKAAGQPVSPKEIQIEAEIVNRKAADVLLSRAVFALKTAERSDRKKEMMLKSLIYHRKRYDLSRCCPIVGWN
jgi:hypothetical protein